MVYGDAADLGTVRRSLRAVMRKTMELYRDDRYESGYIPQYNDWFSLVDFASTASEADRGGVFGGTPLSWMAADAAWAAAPAAARSLAVRLAHVWRRGGVALASDAIVTNGNDFSSTIFELMAGLMATAADDQPVGLLSWRDAKQAIVGDAMFVFASQHPFVRSCMDKFRGVYVAGRAASDTASE